MYDGSEEFWIVVKETGKREESRSFEEKHEKKGKAWHISLLKKNIFATSTFGSWSNHVNAVYLNHRDWEYACFSEATGEPKFELAGMFEGDGNGLAAAASARLKSEAEKSASLGPSLDSKYMQVRLMDLSCWYFVPW